MYLITVSNARLPAHIGVTFALLVWKMTSSKQSFLIFSGNPVPHFLLECKGKLASISVIWGHLAKRKIGVCLKGYIVRKKTIVPILSSPICWKLNSSFQCIHFTFWMGDFIPDKWSVHSEIVQLWEKSKPYHSWASYSGVWTVVLWHIVVFF